MRGLVQTGPIGGFGCPHLLFNFQNSVFLVNIYLKVLGAINTATYTAPVSYSYPSKFLKVVISHNTCWITYSPYCLIIHFPKPLGSNLNSDFGWHFLKEKVRFETICRYQKCSSQPVKIVDSTSISMSLHLISVESPRQFYSTVYTRGINTFFRRCTAYFIWLAW